MNKGDYVEILSTIDVSEHQVGDIGVVTRIDDKLIGVEVEGYTQWYLAVELRKLSEVEIDG